MNDRSKGLVFKNRYLSALRKFVENTHIMALMLIPLIAAGVILFGGLEFLYRQGFEVQEDGIFGILGALSCIVASFTGFIQIYRKETYGVNVNLSIKGVWALISGWFWVLFMASLATMMLWESLNYYFE